MSVRRVISIFTHGSQKFFGQWSAGLNAVFASSWDISAKPRRQLAEKRDEFEYRSHNKNAKHNNYGKLKKLD
jgi:hypothetical protein